MNDGKDFVGLGNGANIVKSYKRSEVWQSHDRPHAEGTHHLEIRKKVTRVVKKTLSFFRRDPTNADYSWLRSNHK